MKRRLSAILAADMVGYSRLIEADEIGTIERHKAYRRELIDPAFAEFYGRIVKEMGDGILVEFPSVVDAVRCAVRIQREMARREAEVPERRRITYRVGINLGDVVVDGDDIYGDGVNIAARLEGIAAPGGICLSGAAFEQISGKLDLKFDHLGERQLKNISKPISVYRAIFETDSIDDDAESPGVRLPLELPQKPSIAVLPFDNMSDDADQEFFADGITEDVITALSQFGELFVIARKSCFTYKGMSVKAQQIRADLGVRYFAQGSVRRAGDRVRVSVQLVDSETANHVWAERYDRQLDDIFEIQDELTQSIVATIAGRIDSAEKSRFKRVPPDPMAALDYLLAGRIHHHRVTPQDNETAIRMLNKAIELAPTFAEAYAWKACTLGQALQFGYCRDRKQVENEAWDTVEKALSLDENNVECHRLLCEVYMQMGLMEKAKVHGTRAHKLNPNDPRLVSQQGELKTWTANPADGEALIRHAMRLDPHGAAGRAHLLGYALYGQRKYAEALEAFHQTDSPRLIHQAFMAASYGQLDQGKEAKELADRLLQSEQDFDIASFVAKLPYSDEADRKHLADGLRKAGLT